MPIFPQFVGQTDPAWTLTCKAKADDGSTSALNLTGYTCTVRVAVAPTSGDPTFTTGGGTIDITNLATGVVVYTPNGSEWSATGTGIVQVKAVKGSQVKYFDYIYGPVYKST